MATKKAAAKKPAPTKSSGRAAKRDAVDVLKADHKEVKALFKQYKTLAKKEADGGERQALAQQICMLLTVHATAEEEIFYPAAAAIDEPDLLDEAEVEHASAKDLIAQIESMNPDDALYDAKVIVLGEYIDHHVEEEETEMFPKCRKSDMDLVALGKAIEARKAELMDALGAVA